MTPRLWKLEAFPVSVSGDRSLLILNSGIRSLRTDQRHVSGAGMAVCVCWSVCVCATHTVRERGTAGIVFSLSYRVVVIESAEHEVYLQLRSGLTVGFPGKPSRHFMKVCVCVSVCV